jgi:ubiquinone/menaquinone biosynthesis C-methylase UbiE
MIKPKGAIYGRQNPPFTFHIDCTRTKKQLMPSDAIKEFWEQQAETFEQSDLATAPDHHYRQLEIREILKHLNDGQRLLDVGYGNGYSTLRFASAFPSSEFIGVDYSPTMVDHAKVAAQNAKLEARVRFTQADVVYLDALDLSGSHDCFASGFHHSMTGVVHPIRSIICEDERVGVKNCGNAGIGISVLSS